MESGDFNEDSLSSTDASFFLKQKAALASQILPDLREFVTAIVAPSLLT